MLPDEPSAKTFQPDQTLLKEEVLQQGSATSKVPAAESATTQILPHIEEDDGASQSIALPIVRANPTVQESTTSKTSSTTKKDLKISAPSASVKSKRPSSTKADKKASSKTTERSLKLQMPTMVSLNKEPVIDFSPSIFENIGQIFPADTNVSSLAVDDKLQELARSYDQSNAVVLKRGTSTEKYVFKSSFLSELACKTYLFSFALTSLYSIYVLLFNLLSCNAILLSTLFFHF